MIKETEHRVIINRDLLTFLCPSCGFYHDVDFVFEDVKNLFANPCPKCNSNKGLTLVGTKQICSQEFPLVVAYDWD